MSYMKIHNIECYDTSVLHPTPRPYRWFTVALFFFSIESSRLTIVSEACTWKGMISVLKMHLMTLMVHDFYVWIICNRGRRSRPIATLRGTRRCQPCYLEKKSVGAARRLHSTSSHYLRRGSTSVCYLEEDHSKELLSRVKGGYIFRMVTAGSPVKGCKTGHNRSASVEGCALWVARVSYHLVWKGP